MRSFRMGAGLFALAVLVGALNTACSRHYVVVTPPSDGYSRRDTLYGRLDGRDIRVTFRFDTIFRTDTVVRVDTLWEEGARVDTLLRVDTVVHTMTVQADTLALPGPVTGGVDTVTVTRVDTIHVGGPVLGAVDTVIRVDTVGVGAPQVRVDTVTRVDTIRVTTAGTVARTDTVRVTVTDTVLRVDTVRLAATDTVLRVDTLTVNTTGPRHLFIPPGHYPPEGVCRVWVPGDPPGQQSDPTDCDGLGDIPGGAFILFGGSAWDADWDWVRTSRENPGAIPPQIVALTRRGRGG